MSPILPWVALPSSTERVLSEAFQASGWQWHAEQGCIKKGKRSLPVLIKRAKEARRPLLQAFLADGILRGRALQSGEFVVIVVAPTISAATAKALEAYMDEMAPGQAFGFADEHGLACIHGAGMEGSQNARISRPSTPAVQRPRDMFSDLNQWLLKVRIGGQLPTSMLSIPRERGAKPTELAASARVSVPVAWRLYQGLSAGGHLDAEGRIVLIPELMEQWKAAMRKPQQSVGASWLLPGRDPVRQLKRALAELVQPDQPLRACLGLFAACDALGLGHVRGAPLHLYVRDLNPDLLERLGLIMAPRGQRSDLVLRVARWPESVFRAAVFPAGVPVTDIMQCWLDVSGEPTRGQEQADFLWRRVLGPALEEK